MVVYQVKISSNTKNHEFRWLAFDINFKLLHTECPIAHGPILKLITLRENRVSANNINYVSSRVI